MEPRGTYNTTQSPKDDKSPLEQLRLRISVSSERAAIVNNRLSDVCDRLYGPMPQPAEQVRPTPVASGIIETTQQELSRFEEILSSIENLSGRLDSAV